MATINYQYYWKHRVVGASGLKECKPGKGRKGAYSAEHLKLRFESSKYGGKGTGNPRSSHKFSAWIVMLHSVNTVSHVINNVKPDR